MKSLETFEETFSDAVLGYLSTLIFSSFFFRYFRRKIVLLQHRAAVAYGCLFSDLQDICNTFTQVAEGYNVLILRKKVLASCIRSITFAWNGHRCSQTPHAMQSSACCYSFI